MPRFFFHVFDGLDILDQDGIELSDWKAAQALTIRYAGEVLQNQSSLLNPDDDWRLEVTDETGLILFRLDLTFTRSAALLDRPATPTDPILPQVSKCS